LAKALLADFPDRSESKDVLAGAYGHVADTAMRSGKVGRAVEALKQSVVLKREIAIAAPDDADAQHRLASAYSNLADALDAARQPDAAVEALEQAIDRARRAVKLDPLNLRSRDLLGRILVRVGDFAELKEDYERSAALYQETLELYRKSLQISPQNPSATQMLIVTYGQLAELERVRKHYDASLAAHRSGIDLLMPMIEASPDNIRLKGGLAYATRNIAMTHLEAGQPEEAVASARRAVELEREIQKVSPVDDQAARNRLSAQFTLAQTLIALSDVPKRAGDLRARDRSEARSLLAKCLDEYDAKSKAGTLTPSDKDTIQRIRTKLASMDASATTPSTSPT
jgi:tetratricopeptide (TPR) repeat protein